jgi:4-hydroxybenzoate polyprenyltransferase
LILNALLAFACFSLCASATYIVNDLLDIDADRRHPKKRHRPFAAGDLSVATGIAIVALFLLLAFGRAAFLPVTFAGWLALYLVTTLAYSLHLKRVVLLDVIILSGLYTLRMLAGGAATQVRLSPWLAAFSVFLFLSLAMVKRFSELQNIRARGNTLSNGRGYLLVDIEQLRAFGTASAYASVVVFALYINAGDTAGLYRHPRRLWIMTPLLILWLSRVWLLASRGELDEDPVIFAVTDRMSLLIGAAIALIAVLATV